MRIAVLLACLLLMAALPAAAQVDRYPELKTGDDFIDFSLPYATKDSVATNELHLGAIVGGKNIVLAFYPADWSGGCTREVCTLRDNFADLSKLNAEIIGISGDYVYTHHEWASHHSLPFLLASDHLHAVAARYRSYNESTGYNKRTVYVIDTKGKIAYVDLAYSTKDLTSFTKLQEALSKLP
jgi:peroxiredoxin